MRPFLPRFLPFSIFSLLLLLGGCQPAAELEQAVITQPAATGEPLSPAATLPAPSTTAPQAPTAVPTSVTGEEDPALSSDGSTPAQDAGEWPAGSLLSLRMEGRVGVLLDEYPAEMRDRVVASLSAQPASVWETRALQQVDLTYYRLHFRDYIYRKVGIEGKKQLPLPPRDLWRITLDPAGPRVETIDGHSLLTLGYTFESTLLSDEASPAAAEPALAEIGGVWDEPFVLPADPTMLLQRTGNACLNEAGFPPNSYDSENVSTFFDYSCQAEDGGQLGCHRTTLPQLSCEVALQAGVGRVNTIMRFERLAWNDDLAAAVRRGELTRSGTPDLSVVSEDLANNRIVYRYFPADSCALQEGCVGGSGWRRLLMFDATVHNIGTAELLIGLVEGEDLSTNLYEYDACHNHIHYSHYGDFILSSDNNPAKRAFCVESTSRLSNNEYSPLTHDFSCRLQGIQTGWVDEYGAGLDCQWIDITDVDAGSIFQPASAPTVETLTFRSNTDQLLCEGTPILDENGERIWRFSGLLNDHGDPILYPTCNLIDNWEVNNSGSTEVAIPAAGSFVTEPCAKGETGPLRNCGFTPQPETISCTPGAPVQLACRVTAGAEPSAPQVLRLCETSAQLGTGTACTAQDALLNSPVGSALTTLTATCPLLRGAGEPGGEISLYTSPLLAGDPDQPVVCEVVGGG